jgi:hypothetical protein
MSLVSEWLRGNAAGCANRAPEAYFYGSSTIKSEENPPG